MSHESPQWVDDLLKDALSDRDRIAFETEFDAILALVNERKPRAVIVAAAALALATHALRSACVDQQIPDETERRQLRNLVDAIFDLLPPHQGSYIPAILATLLLEQEK